MEYKQQPIDGAEPAAPPKSTTVWGHKGEFVHDTGNTNTWSFKMVTGPSESEGERCEQGELNLYKYTRINNEPEYYDDCQNVSGSMPDEGAMLSSTNWKSSSAICSSPL